MSTTIKRGPMHTRHGVPVKHSRVTLVNVVLGCGIAYGLLYIVANDVIAAMIYDGYNRIDQAISELSATEAPSRAFLTAMLPIFTLLMIGFGIGVWKSAEGNRALRVTGAVLIAQGAMFPLWLLAPMTSREEIVEGTMPANDVGHIILSAAAVLLILLQMGFGAAALDKRFRLFSLLMLVTVLVFGALTGMLAPNVQTGDPTPWMGFVERISYGAWLLWMAMLAIILLRTRSDAQKVIVRNTPAESVETASRH